MPIHARVENYLKVVLNAPIFPQLCTLTLEASPRILVANFLIFLELRAVKVETTKKVQLVWKFAFSNLMACNSRTIRKFATKTHGEASLINVSN